MADASWERLEAFLFNHEKDGSDISAAEYAAEEKLGDVAEASEAIQEYLREQRKQESNTLYVLRRVPGTRTRNARWAVGTKTKDARLVGKAFVDDVRAKIHRAMAPDLKRLRDINPRTARLVDAQVTAIMDGAMTVLAAAAEGTYSSGDNDDE